MNLRVWFPTLGTAILPFVVSPSVFAQDDMTVGVRVSAHRLNVRDGSGRILCTVSRGQELSATARHPEGDRLKVNISQKGCPGEGFVYTNYVRPTNTDIEESMKTKVEPSNLALRKSPRPSGAFLCGLPRDTNLTVIQEDPPNAYSEAWVKVKVTPAREGCPDEGYVNSSYLLPQQDFNSLPIANIDKRLRKSNTQAGLPCEGSEDCQKPADAFTQNVQDGKAVAQIGPKNPFVEDLRKMIKNPRYEPEGFQTSRGLIQMPVQGNRGNIGPCGSHHYNPEKGNVDIYANPLTACTFTAALQKWKQDACPGGGGCRVAWGDISHATRPKFNGHATHTDGECIDIRPMRNGGFEDAPLTFGGCKTVYKGRGKKRRKSTTCWKNDNYDQATTKKFVDMLVNDFGGTNEEGGRPYFNDTSIGTGYSSGHAGHIHICFKNNPKTRAACANLVIDPAVCGPELM